MAGNIPGRWGSSKNIGSVWFKLLMVILGVVWIESGLLGTDRRWSSSFELRGKWRCGWLRLVSGGYSSGGTVGAHRRLRW